MTLAQFPDYGVAVTKILQTDQTYLVSVGLSSAIADALPPENADGTYNEAAQDAAISQIVAATATSGFICRQVLISLCRAGATAFMR